MNAFHVLDALLLLGMALRVTRMITTDDVPGGWYLRDPLLEVAVRKANPQQRAVYWETDDPADLGWRGKVLAGLGCPFCVGFWLCVLATLSLLAVGGPGHAAEAWRWVAAALTLNYVAAHISAALD